MDITVTREELVEIIEAAFDLGYKKGTKEQKQYEIKDSNTTGTFLGTHDSSLGIIPQTCTKPIKPYGMEFKYNGTER